MKYSNAIGIIQKLSWFFDQEEKALLDEMIDAGLETVQVLVNDFDLMTEAHAEQLMKMTEGRLRITSVWCSWTGPSVWNFVDGPGTLGLVPEAYRGHRLMELKRGADFAKQLGVHDMTTHVGFIPEQPCYDGYRGLVAAVSNIAAYCAERDLFFNFETGQETPVTLMRLFSDVGRDNLGINLDPANLIAYGRGNPIDALNIYNGKIRGVHIKDADYPQGDFYRLGRERLVGEGSVNFPVFLPKLLAGGYQGDLYIEREITGRERADDVIKTIQYVKKFLE